MNKILDFIKNNKVFFVSSIIFVISLFIILFGRGTYSVEDDNTTNELTINCPDSANVGETIECSLNINVADMKIYGINAKYELTEGLVVGDFISDNWEVYLNDENGFVRVNLDGVVGNAHVGTVKITMPTDAVSNSKYVINIKDINVGNGEDTVLNLDEVSDEIRIKSDINTLDSITLTDATLNETFEKDIISYTAKSDAEKINISVVKTDEYSVVSGDIGDKDIHYGTNKFSIVVTSETGKVKTYSLEVYKEFVFSSDKYVYNKDNNYLYVGSHRDDNIILNNIDIPNELSKKIENNQLIISYGDEVLYNIKLIMIYSDTYDLSKDYIYLGRDEFDISNITFVNCDDNLLNDKLEFKYNGVIIDEFNILSLNLGDLFVDSNIITISEEMSYEDFTSNISLNSNIFEYKILNGDIIIDGEDISDRMSLKIYYNNNVIDSYNIVLYNLSFSDKILTDEVNGYIKYKPYSSTVEEFLKDVIIVGNANVYVIDKDNNKKENTDLLCTGDKLIIYIGSRKIAEYQIAVRGDANGDGRVSLLDLSHIRKHIAGTVDEETGKLLKKEGIYAYAIDINDDNRISLLDLSKVRKIIVGIDIDA